LTRLVLAACALVALLVAAPAGAATPRAFFGVMADGPLLAPDVDLAGEARRMRTAGAGSVRVAVYWRELQPVAGGPVEWAPTDRVVAAAAAQGLAVLPVLLRAPAWATGGDEREGAVPDPAAYAAFCRAAVLRYGPRGSFWAERPSLRRMPIRAWQVWNEPDIERYLSPPPGARWPATYVRLLRAAHGAIEGADPGAQVVAAGLTNESWKDLAALYRAGGRRWFDVAAIHPFSRRVENVLKIVALARAAMRRAGDARAPLAVTELSWTSGRGRSTINYGWETTERGQAARVRAALTGLAAVRRRHRLHSVHWYTWLSPPLGDDESFSYAGLRRQAGGRIVDKPALAAFRAATRASR
jgi:hypothetical protein